MEHLRTSVFISFLCAAFLLSVPAQAWELYDEDDGVKSYRKKVPGSSVVAFKGETTINASVEKLFGVLADNDRRTDWVDRLKNSRVIERKGPFEQVVYQHFDLPWPISDRDYVYNSKAVNEGDTLVLYLNSIVHRAAPKSVGVRAQLNMCRYVLTPKGPDTTHVMVEVHTDPKGMLPNWLINLIQKKWPIKTLSGIRRQVRKPFVVAKARPPKA